MARRVKKKRKSKKSERIFLSHKDPTNLTLHLIGFIIMIYGAWFHNIFWILLGFIPPLVGHWWESVHKK